jgi:pachytene checkpoint protein 2
MLSKYFGESSKLIGGCFERIFTMAQDPNAFICVVMDEVETIAGSREKSTSGSECADGLRATNQLLTALDRLRGLPNIIVLCTSNLIGSIDQAFLDRVDIKQLIPPPSPEAIYNIFRSCLNELVRSSLVDNTVQAPIRPPKQRRTVTRISAAPKSSSSSSPSKSLAATKVAAASSPSPEPWTMVPSPEIPMFSEMQVRHIVPKSPGRRVWHLAQKCNGFSGRTLRRLPILGLAMYTWGGTVSLDEAVSALEAAVEQELMVMKAKVENV